MCGGTLPRATPTTIGSARKPKRTLTFGEETFGLSEWATRIGIGTKALSERLRKGWSVERALTTPLDKLQSKRSRHK